MGYFKFYCKLKTLIYHEKNIFGLHVFIDSKSALG